MPAAFCHAVGLKVTTGRISGGPAAADQFGHGVPGFVTRTVRDAAALVDAVAGPHPADLRRPAPLPPAGLLAALDADPGALRIGVLDHDPTGQFAVDEEVAEAVRGTGRLLDSLGHHLEEAHPAGLADERCLEMFHDALSVGVSQSIDALTREVGAPPGEDELDPITRYWERRGRQLSGQELAEALSWQGQFRSTMARWWYDDGFDLLLLPVFPSAPKPHGWPWAERDGLRRSVDVLKFTAPFNTTGQPAVAVPHSLNRDGLPIGIQLVAAAGREDQLVQVAAQIERHHPWAEHRPPGFAA
jgi:amidase